MGHAALHGVLVLVLVGVAGAFLAKSMHKHHWHWHWGLLLVGVTLVMGFLKLGWLVQAVPLVGFLGLTGVGLVALLASYHGGRWQRMDEQSGGERAKTAKERRTPSEAWRRLGNRLERHQDGSSVVNGGAVRVLARLTCAALASWAVSSVPRARGQRIFLGYDIVGNKVYIPMKHIFLVGATESGKTTTIRRILEAIAQIQMSLNEDIGAVVIDGKGDPELKRAVERFARILGCRFRDWNPHGTLRYNFLAHGHDTELVDRALSSERYSDDYFLRIAQRFLGVAVRGLRAAGEPVTLANIAKYMLPENIADLYDAMEEIEEGSGEAFANSIPEVGSREEDAIRGSHHRLATLSETDIGRLLEPAEGEEVLDLLESVRNHEVVYFDLHASASRETAKMLGAVIIMDLVSVFAVLQYNREYHRTLVIPDDIEAFANEAVIEGVVGLYARSRSVGAMMILGTQGFTDIEAGKMKARIDQILGNVRTRIIHRLPGHESAEVASKVLGEHEETKVTERVDSGLFGWKPGSTGTRTTERVRNVFPGELMELEDGEAVVHTSGRGSEPVFTSICPPSEDGEPELIAA